MGNGNCALSKSTRDVMNRILEFDGIRAVAILMIVLCHICYSMEGFSNWEQHLDCTYNFVFFIIPALLIGLKVNKSKCTEDLWPLLWKRISRLLPELWIFLTI